MYPARFNPMISLCGIRSPDVSPRHEDRSRASSVDRAEALAALSRGYSQHVFGLEEYRRRVKQANDARTREDLYAVVRDLPLDGTLPEDYDAQSGNSRGLVLLLLVIVLVLAGVIVALVV